MSAPIRPIHDPDATAQAADLIQAGELVIIPTDTIYGIATQAEKEDAIRRLYEARDRDLEPASPFLMINAASMNRLARPNRIAEELARRFWPGALTLLLPPAADLPQILRRHPVALRVPNFPPLFPLLEAIGGELFASGAIRAGHPPAITAQEAETLFGDGIALILDGGPAVYGLPSTIVDCVQNPPVIVRRGAIPEEKVWSVLNLDRP